MISIFSLYLEALYRLQVSFLLPPYIENIGFIQKWAL